MRDPQASRGGLWPVLMAAVLALGGCRSHHVASATRPASSLEGLSEPKPVPELQAIVCPPVGWKIIQQQQTIAHVHWTWTSASGDTAYGVVYVHLPLPVGTELTLVGFLAEMRQAEGSAQVLEKHEDRALPGLRFVAQSPVHKIRANLITHGFEAWVIYAGVLQGRAENEAELKLAERAREATIVGLPR